MQDWGPWQGQTGSGAVWECGVVHVAEGKDAGLRVQVRASPGQESEQMNPH